MEVDHKRKCYKVYLMHEMGTQALSDISRKLRAEDAEAFKCKTCVKGAQSLNKLEAGCVELDDGSKFELLRNSAIVYVMCRRGSRGSF